MDVIIGQARWAIFAEYKKEERSRGFGNPMLHMVLRIVEDEIVQDIAGRSTVENLLLSFGRVDRTDADLINVVGEILIESKDPASVSAERASRMGRGRIDALVVICV